MMTNYLPKTIVKYINVFRDLVISNLKKDNIIVGERNIIVEIDELKFKRNKNFWIFDNIKRTERKKYFFEVVKD